MASGFWMVQLLLSLSPTNVFPSALILPVTLTAFAELSAFMLSCFIESCATATPHSSRPRAKQIVISFFIWSPPGPNYPLNTVETYGSHDRQNGNSVEQVTATKDCSNYRKAGLYADWKTKWLDDPARPEGIDLRSLDWP